MPLGEHMTLVGDGNGKVEQGTGGLVAQHTRRKGQMGGPAMYLSGQRRARSGHSFAENRDPGTGLATVPDLGGRPALGLSLPGQEHPGLGARNPRDGGDVWC